MPLPHIGLLIAGSAALVTIAGAIIWLDSVNRDNHHFGRARTFGIRHRRRCQWCGRAAVMGSPQQCDCMLRSSHQLAEPPNVPRHGVIGDEKNNEPRHGPTTNEIFTAPTVASTDAQVPVVTSKEGSGLCQRQPWASRAALDEELESLETEYSYMKVMEQELHAKRQQLLGEQAELLQLEQQVKAQRQRLSQTSLAVNAVEVLQSELGQMTMENSDGSCQSATASPTTGPRQLRLDTLAASSLASSSASSAFEVFQPTSALTTAQPASVTASAIDSAAYTSALALPNAPSLDCLDMGSRLSTASLLSTPPSLASSVSDLQLSQLSTVPTALEDPVHLRSPHSSMRSPLVAASTDGHDRLSTDGSSWIDLDTNPESGSDVF
ncbi:hypothetical protein H4R35_005770 [Dimargaris xerosporica]|nr:hypothetical protein H4R35_005770 [Dimargaris xerosporica]